MRRLSIIDVTHGHQPLFSEARDVACVCNGEIYNFQPLARQLQELGHVFATRSDVEVLAHGYEEWGDDVVTKLNGMFALAVWDARRQRLLLARDRVGKKPLYYARIGSALVFASELRSLLTVPGAVWSVDREACRAFCALGYLPGDRTPITQIQRLAPGHTGVWSGTELKIRRYWQPHPETRGADKTQAVDALLHLLDDSVQLRLISDVPLGAFLSGGLDSSIVVAIAAGRLGARIPTFNVSFPGYSDHDEAPYARRVAEHFGCEHHEIPVDASHFRDLAEVVWALDEPLADPAALPTLLLSREARKSVTVALTGEGADEIFGGYERYALALRGSALVDRFSTVRGLAATGLRVRGRRSIDDSRLSRLLRAAAAGGTDPLAWSRAVATAAAVPQAAGWDLDVTRLPSSYEQAQVSHRDHSRLLPVQLCDLGAMLPNGLLTKVDRMTMAASLEARCPFLDYRVVDFGLGLPDSWKIRGWTSKVLLRVVAQRLLPRQIHTRPKHTFRVPLAEWLRGPLKELLNATVASPVLRDLGILAGREAAALADDHLERRADFSRALWALITLHLWFSEATGRVTLHVDQ